MLKKMLFLTIGLGLLFSLSELALAEWVDGYMKDDGTYIQGHHRSDSNNTVQDNYSYYGNVNPYGGAVGTNKYRNNPTSAYYSGGSASDNSQFRMNTYSSTDELPGYIEY